MNLLYTDENNNHISVHLKQGNYFATEKGQIILLLNKVILDENYNFVNAKDENFGIVGDNFINLIANQSISDIPVSTFFEALEYVYLKAYAVANNIENYEIK